MGEKRGTDALAAEDIARVLAIAAPSTEIIGWELTPPTPIRC